MTELRFDWERRQRTGVGEAVFAPGKSLHQLGELMRETRERGEPLLITRLDEDVGEQLALQAGPGFDYDPVSRTGIVNPGPPAAATAGGLIVTAGTSDLPVAREAQRTLAFHGLSIPLLADCGVAGLWRLLEQREALCEARVIIAVAGMEGAVFPVIAGITPALVIAVPTSVGYGVAHGGTTALHSALAACAPGIVTVNIDNGFGAACAMIKILRDPAHGSPG